ncbi:hypothetical protein O0L34_g11869 [Tuta absoluta]|nr:hypothetical protein O0L34_g11869 [Tuta absoluta]
MWTGTRKTREYRFLVIEEVMQQRAPVVPISTKLQQSSANQVKTSALSANFFKTTFSSRNKAVPATSSFTVESVTKIGNSETKPVTRNRPKTVPDSDPSSRHKLKRTVKSAKKPEKALDPERPFRLKQLTPAPRLPKAAETIKARPNHDLKSPNVVLQIVKKSHAPTKPHVAKEVESVSILPPSLRPKEAKPNLKLTKNINNNDVWAPATEAKIRHKLSTLPIR